jgi:hypothetical protein
MRKKPKKPVWGFTPEFQMTPEEQEETARRLRGQFFVSIRPRRKEGKAERPKPSGREEE